MANISYSPSQIKKTLRIFKDVHRVPFSKLRALPNFIIIGAQKAGTTSLYHYLGSHPQITMSSKKEVHYFDLNFSKGENWYRTHFPFAKSLGKETIIGESSPYYLVHPHAPLRIHKLLPTIKLIVLLRNPVERAISHYFHEKKKGRESLPIMEAMAIEEERISLEWKRMVENSSYHSATFRSRSYKRRGMYLSQLKRYFQYFSKEQLLIVDSEGFFENPKRVLKKIYRFLLVDSDFENVDLEPMNIGLKNSDVPSEARDYLKQYFYGPNQDLYDYLNMDFNW